MSDRRIDVFFYGLFVDVELLRQQGVTPANPRRAQLDGFALRIGQRAAVVPSPGTRVYGVVVALTFDELDRLYAVPSLKAYRPEAVLAQPREGSAVPALCYTLPEAPRPEERNPEYAARLQRAASALGFPPEYVESIA